MRAFHATPGTEFVGFNEVQEIAMTSDIMNSNKNEKIYSAQIGKQEKIYLYSNMGNFLKSIARHIFEYPIKRKPICFYRQEDFSSTEPKQIIGEPIKVTTSDKEQVAEYEQLVNSFYENLKAKRKMTKLMQEQNRRHSLKKILKKFPGWDEMTISNLHNLFLLFDDNKNAMLALEDFCALLESLGDNSSYEVRNAKFEAADLDGDGWITYDEFLPAIYNFNPPEKGVLQGLGKMCFEASENIRFISSLTVGEQLEYGLF